MKAASWLNLIVGIWLLISPTVLNVGAGPLRANAVIFGIAVIVISIWSLLISPANHVPAWLNALIGVWMFISGWVLGYNVPAAPWNGLITGVLLVIFSITRMWTPRMTTSRA